MSDGLYLAYFPNENRSVSRNDRMRLISGELYYGFDSNMSVSTYPIEGLASVDRYAPIFLLGDEE